MLSDVGTVGHCDSLQAIGLVGFVNEVSCIQMREIDECNILKNKWSVKVSFAPNGFDMDHS